MAEAQHDTAVHVLYDTLAVVTKGGDLADVMGEICTTVRRGFGFDDCAVTSIEDDGAVLRTVASSAGEGESFFGKRGAVRPLQVFPCAVEAARTQVGWFCDDLNELDLPPKTARHLPRDPQIRGVCIVPLIVDGRTVGLLHGFHFHQPQHYDQATREAFAAVGELAATVLKLARLQHRIGQSEQRYRELVELSSDLVLTWNPDGSVMYASPAARRLSGLGDDLAGTDLLERVHPEDRQRTREVFERLTTSTELLSFDNRIISAVGREHRIHWDIYPVRDETGRLTHIHGIGRDLSEGDQLQERLQGIQRSESVARLARGLAHKLNNVLVSVLGNTSVLAGRLDEDHPWRPIAGDIMAGAEQAAKLIRQLLTYARPTPYMPQRRRLRDLLAECLELGQTALPSNVTLEIRAEAENDWIEADAMQFQQVVIDLVLNAAEAMPDGGGIIVRTSEADWSLEDEQKERPCVALIVEDTGVGIRPEDRERIFHPFFSTKEMGLGLGLAGVQGIVQAHGGKIEIQGEPGKGTAVWVLLPLADPEQ